MHSGQSGLASLYTHSVDYFNLSITQKSIKILVNRTEDNRSRLAEESGESGSDTDNTNSMNVEDSDREY